MAEEVAIRGASSVTVARVIARAGVSRRLFYKLFADIDECFLECFDWAVEQGRAVAVEAYGAETSWREGIRAGLAALLRFFDEQPLLAQLCVVHAAGSGSRVLERRSRLIGELCDVIDRGGSEAAGGRPPGPVVAEGVVGAVIAVLYTRLLARGEGHGDRRGEGHGDRRGDGRGDRRGDGRGDRRGEGRGDGHDEERGEGRREGHGERRGERRGKGAARGDVGDDREERPLIELHGELMSLIVLPYLGAGVAGRELRKPAPPARSGTSRFERAPAGRTTREGSAARLTYRTVRVLRAIGELPAGSNREVAEHAGIVDQGQISKILTRLEYQGLVVNRGGNGTARGMPNSWWLTERGEALARELREQPSGERSSGKQLSGKQPSGEQPSGKRPSGKRLSGKRLSGEGSLGERSLGERGPSAGRGSDAQHGKGSGSRRSAT